MGKRGGKRNGAGRKVGSVNEETRILRQLRERITDDDFDLALGTVRYAMKQKKQNLKVATSAAQFIIEQKAGKAPQPVTGGDGGPISFNLQNILGVNPRDFIKLMQKVGDQLGQG